MKAAFFSYDVGLRVLEVDDPSPNEWEVLVEIKAAGLCASDLHFMDGRFRYSIEPIIPGHEGCGVVKKVGKEVNNVSVGDQVAIHYVLRCSRCKYCLRGEDNLCRDRKFYGFDLNGTFAQQMLVLKDNVISVNNMPFEIGAIAGCAISTPYRAIKNVGGVEGKDVAIIGLGGVGMHAVLLCRLLGAERIIGIETDESKWKLAYEYGADYIVNPIRRDPRDAIVEYVKGGVDVAFEFVGSPETIHYTLNVTKDGGVSVIAGLVSKEVSVNFSKLILSGKKIVTTIDHTFNDLYEVLDILRNKKVDVSKSITHKFKLDNIEEAIKLFRKKSEPFVRIIINP
ncbi:MAG: zinc-binding dehydrogenase [Nitrososphaerales archaeon]